MLNFANFLQGNYIKMIGLAVFPFQIEMSSSFFLDEDQTIMHSIITRYFESIGSMNFEISSDKKGG